MQLIRYHDDMVRKLSWWTLVGTCAGLLMGGEASAASGSAAVASPMVGNGHNVSFDGRVFVVTQGPTNADGGWFTMVLRPQNIRYRPGGTLDLEQGAFTDPVQIQPWEQGENALALCEANADDTPYACDDAGTPTDDGPFDCYEWWVVDSDAFPNQYNGLRRRSLKMWVANPGTADAAYHRHEWQSAREPMSTTSGAALRGIEPAVTRDGRLLVWQGHPSNDGAIDVLMYATADEACGASGWDGPHVISHMHADPRVVGTYALGERQLRAADGQLFADGALVRGAYPWLFPEGDAINFTATVMPCLSDANPPGCGARRNMLSVIGYPTNWGIAPIDSGLNPTNNDQVRLFFSSPGATTFDQLPLTGGIDVWPMFGSNTGNSGDIVFDDGLDGEYAGVWHMNESVNTAGQLDTGRTPDTSGHFNPATVIGAGFPPANNGLFGKALVFDGVDDRIEVPHDDPLNPLGALSIETWVMPTAPVDCDANNNYRVLLAKGGVGTGAYSIVFEENERLHARVRVNGEQRSVWSEGSLVVGEWSRVGVGYDGTTGEFSIWINGERSGLARGAPGQLDGDGDPLRIGGPGPRAACPAGDGSFAGLIDEVAISRVLRDLSIAARPGNGARFVEQDVPAEVEVGQPFTATFTFTNVGTTAWATGLQHRLGAQAPQDGDTWGTARISFPTRVEPREQITITAELTAPDELGTYTMQWQMLQELTEWFGPMTEAVEVEVVPYVPEPETSSTSDGGGGDDSTSGEVSTSEGMSGVSGEATQGDAGGDTDVEPPGGDGSGGGAGGCACTSNSNEGGGGSRWLWALLIVGLRWRRES